eukprot:m.75449 g.75449  ORF g.75449 m.75449 type:complete len:96 (+) comp17167_c0_seq1:125-412(+)
MSCAQRFRRVINEAAREVSQPLTTVPPPPAAAVPIAAASAPGNELSLKEKIEMLERRIRVLRSELAQDLPADRRAKREERLEILQDKLDDLLDQL